MIIMCEKCGSKGSLIEVEESGYSEITDEYKNFYIHLDVHIVQFLIKCNNCGEQINWKL